MESPVYTLKEAALIAGVSPSTLRRRKDDLRSFGAVCDSHGWQVTRDQLAAVGLLDIVRPVNSEVVPDDTPLMEGLKRQIEDLKAECAAAEQRAAVAEALAQERLMVIQAQWNTIQLLQAPDTRQAGETAAPSKHWWRRLIGR